MEWNDDRPLAPFRGEGQGEGFYELVPIQRSLFPPAWNSTKISHFWTDTIYNSRAWPVGTDRAARHFDDIQRMDNYLKPSYEPALSKSFRSSRTWSAWSLRTMSRMGRAW